MNQLNEAVKALHEIDLESGKRRKNTDIHPLSILLVTICYIGVTASFGNYDMPKLFSMIIFLIAGGILYDISLKNSFRRLKYILLFPLFLGAANLVLDRQILWYLGKIPITSGMVSMVTLFIKGVFMVYATYFMIIRIGIEGLCLAMRAIHVPGILITQITLSYRYIIVLLREMERMWTSYHMRAPGQKGIQIKAWGSFLGLLFLRSMERADNIYHSMLLRGYQENVGIPAAKGKYSLGKSTAYVLFWVMIFVCLRKVPLFYLLGEKMSGR